MSEKTTLDRKAQADCALFDFGSRAGATAKEVRKRMLEAGFSESEISDAAGRAMTK